MTTGNYIGRFAPSPTGPLHFGSLVTAVASYFQAKQKNGQWLVRIEDIDKEREQKGATKSILKALEAHHLFWDKEVTYQSLRLDYYYHAIEQLHHLNKLYRCQCSRKTIRLFNEKQKNSNNKLNQLVYPGICRNRDLPEKQPHSLRLIVHDQIISFNDSIQGKKIENLKLTGDFVVQKMDGSVTYQLAVAIDDALQNITEVVRGIDLIDSCSKQILILKLLNYTIPQYCHLPVVCNTDGTKLSKQTGAQSVDNTNAAKQLWKALSYLNQSPPSALQNANIKELHCWTTLNWDISKIENKDNIMFYM